MKSRLRRAGHLKIMEAERLTKRADALRVEGRRREERFSEWEEWRIIAKGVWNGDGWWRRQ